jgi:hypothetical protein
MNCTVKIVKAIDPITGMTIEYVGYKELNKGNKCIYFKRKYFAEKVDIIYCKNCKHWQAHDYYFM